MAELELKSGPVSIRVFENEQRMGSATAADLAGRMKALDQQWRTVVLWLMAAPSAFPFYRAFAALAAADSGLAAVLKKAHFFQFDEYPIARESPAFSATFRQLLDKEFFGPLRRAAAGLGEVHALELDGGPGDALVAEYYRESLLQLKAGGAYLLQLKGTGMDGHWGFHGAETPLDGEPALIAVPVAEANIHQQMQDWPALLPTESSVPRRAYTFNVPMFLLVDEIIDNVPQSGKEYSVLAAYGTEEVLPALPSSAIKKHARASACLTLASARALLEFRALRQADARARLGEGTLARLRSIWKAPAFPEREAKNIASMEAVLKSLEML